jgi:hypothetical protein
VKNSKVPVSERALVARINRLLAKQGETLRRCRPDSKWFGELGAYYRLDINHNSIIGKNLDIEALGRELGVLDAWEELGAE